MERIKVPLLCVINLYCYGKNLKLMHVQSLWCSAAALKLYPPRFRGFGSGQWDLFSSLGRWYM